MTSTECFNSIEIYFKIPYTKITEIVDISDHLTISEFIKYVNIEIRQLLRINEKYDIEVVEIDNLNLKVPNELRAKMEERSEETLNERYGHLYTKHRIMGFYIRPVDPKTSVFTRQENYQN